MKFRSEISKYSRIFIGLTLFLSPIAIIYPNFQNQVLAQNNRISLLNQGKGTFSLGGKKRDNVTSVSVILQNDQAQVSFFLGNNQIIRFGGTFTRQTPQQVRINLTNSGTADAGGSLLLEYHNNNVTQLNGQGTLDGQKFNLLFRGDKASSQAEKNNNLNIQQEGEGLFNLQSRQAQHITFVVVTVDNHQKARVSLGLKNGNVINFEGKPAQRDAYSIRINVNNSGMASATGFFTVELAANNSISNLIGQGNIDGQTFLANFR